MPEHRFFVDTSFDLAKPLFLDEEESFHLKNVMRNRIGSIVELINGQGYLAKGEVLEFQKKTASLKIFDIISSPPPFSYRLVQSLCQQEKLDFVIEKGTELGITEFFLVMTDSSIRSTLSDNQSLRLRRLSISALKQSGRLYLPKITLFQSLDECLPSISHFYFGDLDKQAPKFSSVYKNEEPTTLIVGPEKGFSSREISLLRAQPQSYGVKLSSHTLRTETASLAFISLATHLSIN